jgi:hypothetical protein
MPTFQPTPNCLGATLETWTGIAGVPIANLLSATNNLQDPPDQSVRLENLLEAPTNRGESFGCRMKGWLVPPISGAYTFYTKADSTSEFWLSKTPGENYTLEKIAYHTSYATSWSDFSTQESASVSLVIGEAYYFEV